jgi:hypothetical protein
VGDDLLALVGIAERLEGEARAADEGAIDLLVHRADVGDAHHPRAGVSTPLGVGGIGCSSCAWFFLLLRVHRKKMTRNWSGSCTEGFELVFCERRCCNGHGILL